MAVINQGSTNQEVYENAAFILLARCERDELTSKIEKSLEHDLAEASNEFQEFRVTGNGLPPGRIEGISESWVREMRWIAIEDDGHDIDLSVSKTEPELWLMSYQVVVILSSSIQERPEFVALILDSHLMTEDWRDNRVVPYRVPMHCLEPINSASRLLSESILSYLRNIRLFNKYNHVLTAQ